MTLYKRILSDGRHSPVITYNDFRNNVKENSGRGGDFDSGWYAINSNPEKPTHTFVDGVLVPLSECAIDQDEKYQVG